jgi:two-component system, OmpR family, sensor histidine kinase TctE
MFWSWRMAASKSLRTLIFQRLLLPLTLFTVLETAFSYFVTLHYVDRTNDRWLLNSARALSQEIKIRDGAGIVELPPAALEIVKWNDFDKTFFKINSQQRGLLVGESFLPEPVGETVRASPVFSDASLNGEALRMVSMRVEKPETTDVFFVHVGETLNQRREMMRDMLLADLVPQIALVILVGLSLFSALKRGLHPLYRLTGEIAKRSPRDLSPIADTHVVSEVKTLADTTNGLLLRLESAIAAQQRFIANAAHQLRTPLAGLGVQLERAMREDDIAVVQSALEQMRQSSSRMAHTVSQLLALAKAEPVEGFGEMASVDLCLIARQTCMDWAAKALQKRMELAFDTSGSPIIIQGDSVLLYELIANLLDNAIGYGREGGQIQVCITNNPPRLSVSDDGPGVPESERAKIFERFYRLPGSCGDGCGLGLAIVKEIALRHQARLDITQAESGGVQITLVFDAGEKQEGKKKPHNQQGEIMGFKSNQSTNKGKKD